MSKNKLRKHTRELHEEKPRTYTQTKKSKNRFTLHKRLSNFLFGAGFLEDARNAPVFRYLMFLSLLFMAYIFYGYRSEKQIRKANKLQKEIQELRAEYIFTTGELMFLKKQSRLSENVKKLGLKSSTTPPYIIKTNKENLEP
ncbi:MAG: FtsL-like putative cell division protein [Bacteroidia bacterium]|nr:FtsL-like putative cell division protein [Bacteroidia bacterium]